MKLIEYIKEMLVQKGKAAIMGFGTFTADVGGATLKDDDGIMIPPSLTIAFSENDFPDEDALLSDYILAKGDLDKEELKNEMESFVGGIKNSLIQDGSCVLPNLGKLKKPSDGGRLVFEQDASLIMGTESFGLPKIEPRPLTSLTATPPPTPIAKESNRLLIAAIAIPLTVLFVVFLYFLYNKAAYDNVIAYFGNTPTVTNDIPPKDSTKGDNSQVTVLTEDGKDETKPKKDAAAETKDPLEGNQKPETPKESVKKESGTQGTSSTDTGSSSELVISSPDSRFYVIIGSYTDLASAKKRALKCRKIGYGTAKVIQAGNRIRVSLEDFSRKADASAFAAKVGKDYAGAWVFSN